MLFVTEHYRSMLPVLLKTQGVTFGTHVFYKQGKEYVPERLRRHENEHVIQYLRYGNAGFLVRYLVEYIVGRLKGKSHVKAYEDISFEVEARKAERGG